MHPKSSLLLLAVALLSADSGLAQRPVATGVERAHRTFKAADKDKNKQLDPMEALRAQIPSRDFGAQDADKDKKLSKDEFTVYYRHLLSSAGRAVPADLEAEVKRIMDVRKKASGARRPVAGVGSNKPGDPADRSTNARLREARDELEGQRRASAQAQARAAVEAEAARRSGQLQASDAERRAQAAQEREQQRVAEAEIGVLRAQKHVAGLIDAGHMTPEEARNLFVVLTKVGQPGAAKSADELRGALKDARARVTGMVEAKHLTAAMGRSLTQGFDHRATDAAKAFGGPIEPPVKPDAPIVETAETTQDAAPNMGRVGAPRPNPTRPAPALPAPDKAATADSGAPSDVPVGTGGVEPAPTPAVGEVPVRRAQKLVVSLVDQGRVPSSEARAMYQALLLPNEPGAAMNAPQLRKALKTARARVAALVKDGKLSAEDARILTRTYDDRATSAARVYGEAVEASAGAPDAAPALEPARRAQQLVKRLIDRGRLTPREGRAMYKSILDEGQAGAAASPEELREALKLARLRLSGLVQRGHLTTEEGRSLTQRFDARAAAAAGNDGAPKGPDGAQSAPDAGTPIKTVQPVKPAPEAQQPARRAQQLVKGLVDKGRLTVADARVMYAALAEPASAAAPATPEKLRAVLKTSRQRLGALVKAGDLDAQQARTLSKIFDARASALPPEAPAPDAPAVGVPAERKPGGQPERKPEQKPAPKPENGGQGRGTRGAGEPVRGDAGSGSRGKSRRGNG